MTRRNGSTPRLSEEERMRVIALGREGLRFVDIGWQLNISNSTAHNYWKSLASDEDRCARDLAASDLSRARAAQSLTRERPAAQIGPDRFAGCAFSDDPRAAAPALGSIGRAEPFGFSLYGGTL